MNWEKKESVKTPVLFCGNHATSIILASIPLEGVFQNSGELKTCERSSSQVLRSAWVECETTKTIKI